MRTHTLPPLPPPPSPLPPSLLTSQYAEMEMRHRFINHARNVWDRAVTLLPRIDQLWYKYVHMEEMLGNMSGARQVFERWMAFEPDHQGWMAFVKVGLGGDPCASPRVFVIGISVQFSSLLSLLSLQFSRTLHLLIIVTLSLITPHFLCHQFELRYNELDKARGVFERYVEILPSVKAWVRYAKFEMKNGDVALARRCYERAVESLGEDGQTVREMGGGRAWGRTGRR